MSEVETSSAPATTSTSAASAPSTMSLSTPAPASASPASTPAATPGTGATAAGPASWRDTLPADIRTDPSLAKYSDVPALANAYISAAKMIGADKIPVPSKHATDADWENIFNKLGRPETPDKYDLKLPDQIKGDATLVKSFSEAVHKAGVLPKQAQAVMDWWTNFSQQRQTEMQQHISTQIEQGQGRLFQEWGVSKDQKFRQATAAVREFGGDEFTKLLTDTGLDKHPVMLKVMAKVGETLKEDAIHGQGATTLGVSPAEAKQSIASILGNKQHPYWVKEHPGHAGAMAEVEGLYRVVHGSG